MYAQAFGAILGLIICLYEYVYGDFVVMGNKMCIRDRYYKWFDIIWK